MKIKIGENVYLQKYEVAFIVHELSSFPVSIFDEVLGYNEFFYVSGPKDALKFECLIKQPDNIEWLMEQDWIIDYDEYAKMTTAELEALAEELMKEHDAEVADFNSKGRRYKKKHYRIAKEASKKTMHKIDSLFKLISVRKGKIAFDLPSSSSAQ